MVDENGNTMPMSVPSNQRDLYQIASIIHGSGLVHALAAHVKDIRQTTSASQLNPKPDAGQPSIDLEPDMPEDAADNDM